MPISVEFFTLTGPANSLLILKHPPSTGISGYYDVAVDPIGGPAQRGPGANVSPVDFGVTGSSLTGMITYNFPSSDIRSVRQSHIDSGITGPTQRVVYNIFVKYIN